jgi:hypothetical protein
MHRLVFAALVASSVASAGGAAPLRAHAVRRSTPVTVDGRLDEEAWTKVPRQGGFTQRIPKDGAAASRTTRSRASSAISTVVARRSVRH